jgi:hypothetical protein
MSETESGIVKKRTFGDILAELTATDEKLETMTEAEIQAIADELYDKVDALKYILDYLKTRQSVMNQYRKEFQKSKISLQNNHDRLKSYVAFNMLLNDFEKIPGKKWRTIIQYSNRVIPNCVANEELFYKFRKKEPKWIKRVFTWDLDALKDAHKKNDPDVLEIAKLETVPYVKFFVNKDDRK